MPTKRVPVKYPCTLGDYSDDDDMQEEVEDPTLSGGLPENYDDEEDRQSLRTENDDEGDQVECGQGQQEQEDENDEDSSGPDSSEKEDAARAKDRGDGGTPASGSSRGLRSKWSQGSTLASLQRKEWVIISEIPKEGRSTDGIHREFCATCSLMSSARRVIVVLIQYGSVASHFGEDGATRRYFVILRTMAIL